MEEIKEKMKLLAGKWFGKPAPKHGSPDYFRRGVDRMIYRQLKRNLERFSYLKSSVEPVREKTIHDSVPEDALVYTFENGAPKVLLIKQG